MAVPVEELQPVAAPSPEGEANADGIVGASVVAGGGISGTSNRARGFCGTGVKDYFRLARWGSHSSVRT